MADNVNQPEVAIEVPEPFLADAGLGSTEEYEIEKATVRLAVTLHPDDGHERGRQVTIVATTHEDAPVARALRFGDLGPLPPAMEEVLARLVAELPARKALAIERFKLSKTDSLRKESEAKAARAAAAARAATGKKPAKAAAKPGASTPTAAAGAVVAPSTALPLFTEEVKEHE